jgi:hypothetical protein
MKNTILIILSIIFTFTIASCEDMMGHYLDKAPGVDVSEDTIFSSTVQCETFLASIYEYGIHSNLPTYSNQQGVESRAGYACPDVTLFSGASDESETCAPWYPPNSWNDGSISPNKPDDSRWPYRWIAIRMVTVMMDRVDGVPGMTSTYKEQLKAEVKVIRAMNYLEMLKRYGGVPIINHRLQVSDNLKIPRSSVDSIVNFIVKDCDEAIPYLPINQTGSFQGRIHQGVALAIKSKTLLYAASPLFNTATPYFDFGVNNKLICYGNYSVDRWKTAAAAAKAALDWAPGAGCHLIIDQGVDKNYQYAWEHYDNPEIILAHKGYMRGRWDWPWSDFSQLAPGAWGQSGITPLLNFVKKYEKRDGTPETWNAVGVSGNDLQEKIAEIDYRFKQSICYNMSAWNKDIPVAPLYQEAIALSKNPQSITTCYGGFWLHKLYPYIISDDVWQLVPNSTIFQLNEIYLNYAEAMNEAFGPDADNGYGLTARQALNTIRSRSGQPDAMEADLKERIRNEREIELAFDNHRFWDIRRWMIAEQEGVMKGGMIGIKINLIDPNNTKPKITSGFKYTPYVYETRSFTPKMYLHPFSTDEVNKGYLVQNPGY